MDKKTEQVLEDIAEKHLGINTLKVRNSDSLDFHDVGVASLKAALEAAYRAGAQSQTYLAGRTRDE